ncbi:LOW QUALITY PROTEIN: family with sequence similarity 21 [Choristoneura fumiferana]|uniref:LOW QUALITY PROTEIN: family with sequence similarity 21 n=1 Tax=Choristoneura fumiferana TaxID=7141 RepID=UPI003D15BAA5
MAEGTAALRAAAPHWSLAGDQQLLDVLQNIHQRIITRCNETTARLELMSKGLRDASVNLQNVNNKFLALSNTQFVECRVYEDDADLAAPPPSKEPPQLSELSSDLSKLKQSLQILEGYHEPLHILRDSDSDSDSDGGDDRLVLKPKDLYSDRPLPYIIGSQAWKNKWHAGLIQDVSDSDSSTSKVGEVEQFSESEEEQTDRQLEGDYQPARKQSTGSSSVQSDAVAVSVSPVRPSPSSVAAELARRLGGDAKLPEREPVYIEPDTVVRKLYKPQQTPSAPIFSDEPPPLDSDDDIFAELHKPHQNQRSHADALFDFAPKGNSLEEALFGRPPVAHEQNESTSQPPLFEDDLIPEVRPPPEDAERDDNIKKPVGGISLFGTNKHAESIGAAILKRNRRKSSRSGDESNTEEVKEVKKVKEVKAVTEVKKERDIFDDLFAKSEKLNKKSAKVDEVKPKDVVKKKDAFSDIFDDIDDIFSTDIVNVPIKETKKNEKPLFDDDDDLFADISKANDLGKSNVKIIEKGNFRDDSQLKSEKNIKDSKINVIKDIKKESKSLFDSDSEDGLFTNVTKNKLKDKVDQAEKPVEYKISDDIFGDDDDDSDGLFASSKTDLKEKLTKSNTLNRASEVSKTTLFDSDDESISNNSKITESIKDTKNNTDVIEKDDSSLFVPEIKRFEKKLKESKSINYSSDLFNSEKKSNALDVIESINKDIFSDGDDLFKKSETIKESKIETVHENVDGEKPFSDTKLTSKDSVDENQGLVNTPAFDDPSDFEPKPPEDGIFDKPDTQTGYILRTTRIAADEENTITQQDKVYLMIDDELFRTVPPIPKEKEHEVDKNVYLHEDIPKTDSPEIFSTNVDKNDIFSDIFDDVPPIFEKPKEPKKSQNVNALYGDDSDDEALFFKKNDVISDEKPDFSQSGERFGIFNDEPPALDVDFVQKPIKNDSYTPSAVKPDDFSPELDASNDIASKSDDKEYKPVPKETQDTTDNTSKEPKKIGKLKPMNFNINVNTLLPGASPKKKQLEDTDGQTASNEELHKTDKIEPKMVKSISFDDPEILDNKLSKERPKIQVKRRPSTRRARKEAVRKSAIDLTDSSLDSSNDNSVKDDVKVVKTVYILNDDDIFGDSSNQNDNSTENKKKHLNIVDSDEELFKKEKDETDSKVTKDKGNESNDVLKLLQANAEKNSFLESDDDDLCRIKDAKLKEPKQDDEIKEVQNEKKTFLDSDDSDDLFKTNAKTKTTAVDVEKSNISDENLFKKSENKNTKIFLDSDENDDLFTNKTTKIAPKPLKSNISSDEEDIFTNINKKGIETLGKVYQSDTQISTVKAATVEKEIHNVFDDFPPKPEPVVEEIVYVKPQEIKEVAKEKTVVKKSILDVSSDEDDLFKAKTKLTTKKDKSLFGDDDNDDDLFGANKVKEIKQVTTPAPQPTKEAKPAETVFIDPLSLFGDDE